MIMAYGLRIATLCLSLALFPFFINAQSLDGGKIYSDAENKLSLAVPKNWASHESEYTALRGSKVKEVAVTQYSDLVSRTAKYFLLETGSPEAIFGLSSKVVGRVSREQMLDFYIDQNSNFLIDFNVTKFYTNGADENKIYIIEAEHLVPGPYKVVTTDYFQFKNGKVYHWWISYFATHSNYASTLRSIAGSVEIK